jgi:3-deoxy-D-manno-octulosonic-acid transferase
MFFELGAILLVHDSNELASSVGDLIADPDAAARIGEKGRKIVLENRGSLDKLLGLLEPLIGDSVK